MFRNQYDTDVTTFSPEGRLLQVEYAGQAITQGSASGGLRSKDAVVLVANMHEKEGDDLAGCREKVFKIDEHMAIAISGIVPDARVLTRYMINECLNHQWAFETPMNTGRLVSQLSDKAQVYTQKSEKRPYGVGMLVGGVDKTGPHLYVTSPSGDFWEYEAFSIGARCQSARTYFEKHFETFADCKVDELVNHGLTAIKTTTDDVLTTKNVSVAIIQKGQPVKLLSDEELRPFLDAIKDEEAEEEKEEKEEDTTME
jgi:20S proteasome subunit alpha 6